MCFGTVTFWNLFCGNVKRELSRDGDGDGRRDAASPATGQRDAASADARSDADDAAAQERNQRGRNKGAAGLRLEFGADSIQVSGLVSS